MRANLLFLLKMFLFWMALFAVLRFIFILYNQQELYYQDISTVELLQAFYHALRVDVATAGYLLMVTLILITLGSVLPSRAYIRIHNAYVLIILAIFGLITAGELGVYPEWKTKLSAKALQYLRRPDEAFLSIPSGLFLNLFGIAVLVAFLGGYLYRRFLARGFAIARVHPLKAVAFILISGALLFTGMRGGIGPIPISPSAAYFSQKSFLNHAAVNTGFNLAISLLESNKFNYSNPFNYYTPEAATEVVDRLNRDVPDSTFTIINASRPNIVILLMESWSADLVESLGGEPGITPRFAEIEKEGVLFTDFYASGGRSQQAIASLLGGFPATPYTTITENADKYSKLPSLVKILKSEDYHTSFYFGGELTYGNIKAFLYHNEFDRIVEQKDFDGTIPSGRLGIHDEYLFDRFLDDYSRQEEPFFSVIFTLSSHSPYDQPMEEVLKWGGSERDFINSAYYSDSCLGVFFEEARRQPWYENTLFILMADHSHNSYRNHKLESFAYHRVPLLFAGPVVLPEYRGVQMPLISQTPDVAVTLIQQLNMEPERFRWGKDLFNPYTEGYAYFELHYAFGWKRPQGAFVYSWDWDHFYQMDIDPGLSESEKELLVVEGKSYLQVLFQEFLDL